MLLGRAFVAESFDGGLAVLLVVVYEHAAAARGECGEAGRAAAAEGVKD